MGPEAGGATGGVVDQLQVHGQGPLALVGTLFAQQVASCNAGHDNDSELAMQVMTMIQSKAGHDNDSELAMQVMAMIQSLQCRS